MSSGANVRTAFAEQTDKDVVPDIGWQYLMNKSNGLNVTSNLTESEMLKDGRIKGSGMVTSAEAGGDISHELMFGAYDELMAGAFWNNWDNNQLTIDKKRKFFAITKDFTDINAFYLWKGCHVSTMKIEINTDGLITIDFGFKALGYETQDTVSFAVNPIDAVDGAKASGISVGDIKRDGVKIDTCIESFSFELDNQAEIQKCLGSNLYGGNVLAMLANISGSMTLAFSPTSYAMLELQRDGSILSLEVPINFPDGKGYVIVLPKIQISGDIPSPSPTDIVTAEISYTVVDESPIIKRIGA